MKPSQISKISLAFVTCFLLTSCSNATESADSNQVGIEVPEIDRSAYSNVHAVLNEENQTVETPLDKYVHTDDEQTQIVSANFFILKKCIVQKGEKYIHHTYQTDSVGEVPLGVWSESYAQKYGSELHKELGRIYVDEGEGEEETPEMAKAYEECSESIASSEITYLVKSSSATSSSQEINILGNVSAQSEVLLERDEDVKSAVKEWVQCLEDNNIPVDKESYYYPSPIQPEDKESDIKQALVDVECKKKVNLMQRYYDALAQYEQALIEENQAVFNSLAETKNENLEKAQKILLENGVTP